MLFCVCELLAYTMAECGPPLHHSRRADELSTGGSFLFHTGVKVSMPGNIMAQGRCYLLSIVLQPLQFIPELEFKCFSENETPLSHSHFVSILAVVFPVHGL